MNWKTVIIGSIIGALALRVLLIPSTWIVLGFVALVLFWNFLLIQFQTQKKLINWGMGIFLAIALASTIGLNLYNTNIKPYTAMSRAATERAKIATDLETALRINPHMLKSKMTLLDAVQWLQDKVGEQHMAEMDGVKRSLAAKQINQEDAWQIIFKIIEDENKNREKAKDAVSKLSAFDSSGKKAKEPNTNLPKGLLIIGAILLGLSLVPKIPIPGKGFWGGIGMLLLVVGLIIWIFPGIQAAANPLPDWSRPTCKEQASAPAPKITELACATVVVPAGEIVNTHFFVRAGQRIWFSQEGHSKRYYIHGDIVEIPVVEKEFTCTFTTSDYVYLRGGPITTTITLNRG